MRGVMDSSTGLQVGLIPAINRDAFKCSIASDKYFWCGNPLHAARA